MSTDAWPAHHDGRRFFNPGHPATDRSLGEVLRWRFGTPRPRWPAQVAVTPARPDAAVDGLRATMIGHATVLIQAPGLAVLTDPVWSERASPLRFAGPRRVTAPGVAFDDLPRIDAVLLSHNHYDHLDGATLRRLHARDAPLIVTPLGNDRIVRAHLPGARVVAGDWGERFDLPGGAEAEIVPAWHWSARTPFDRRRALWSGFMLRIAGRLVYFAGDTGYGDGALFRTLQERFGAPDLALLPIGAYAPRWFMRAQHTDPEEAVRIFADTGAACAIGIHWGTFPLADEPRDEPRALLADALARHGIAAERFVAGVPGAVTDC